MSYHARWAVLCVLLASIPWICAVGFAGVRRVTLAQIGLMAQVLAVGFAAPRLGWHMHPFYTLWHARLVSHRGGNGSEAASVNHSSQRQCRESLGHFVLV
jgi:hypothetical protein